MASRKKSKKSEENEDTPAKSPAKKTNTTPKSDPKGKRKRNTSKTDSSSPVSPPTKTRSGRSTRADADKTPQPSPSPTASRRGRPPKTPEVAVKQSPARTAKSTPNSTPKSEKAKASPKTTPKSSKSPRVVSTKSPKTPVRGSTRTTPKSTRSSVEKESKSEVSSTCSSENVTPVGRQGRKRKKLKSPSPSPTSSTSSEAKEGSSIQSDDVKVSPTNGSNRRKRRKAPGKNDEEDTVTTESVPDSDQVESKSEARLEDSENSNKDSVCSDKSEKSTEAKENVTPSKKTIEKEMEVPKKKTEGSKASRNEEIPLIQSPETCRGAALRSASAGSDFCSSHASNGDSSGIKRRLSNGNDSDPEAPEWLTKKTKAEVMIAAGNDGEVVCATVPYMHVSSVKNHCSSPRKNVSVKGNESPTKLSGKVSPQKCSNKSSTSSLNQKSPTIKKDKVEPSSSSKCNEPLRTGISQQSTNNKNSANDSCVINWSSVNTIKSEKSSDSMKPKVPNDPTDAQMEEDEEILTDAEKLLSTFTLNKDQMKELIILLPADLIDGDSLDILQKLVEKLLEKDTILKTMNAPRLNKLLRQLLMHFCNLDTTVEKKHSVCETALSWAKERKSTNLRHELELTLMHLYFDTGFFRKAEESATALYRETKKLQDKEKTVKACLCLSKAYHAMGNVSKARANITTAKTEALKIYTPPDLQAELDLQSGIMQVAEEKDMETAFSYFKEAATGAIKPAQRSRALKYMLLAKLMINKSEDGEKAVRSPVHINDIDRGVEALIAINKAATLSSLADFKKARDEYKVELDGDMVVSAVLDQLYTKMMEKNLVNIIKPYERVQISFVAEKIGLMREEVERRLSQMILDGEVSAQLDHRDDCLYVYQPEPKDVAYSRSIDTVKELDKTVNHLNKRAKQLL